VPYSNSRDEIPPGTFDVLILKTLARTKQLHGFEIANTIQPTSENILQVEEGSLYPALQRLLLRSAKGTACRQYNVRNSGGRAGPVLREFLKSWLTDRISRVTARVHEGNT
jgi:hypothetical protein